MGSSVATAKPDGTFVLRNVIPDVYRMMFNAPDGTYVKSVNSGDQDASNWRVDLSKGSAPITITLGVDLAVVEGTVDNAKGQPVAHVRVHLIPYGIHLGRQDFSRAALTDDEGHFQLRGTSPGEYKLFAWDKLEPGAQEDPGFRKRFEKQALAVKLEPNAHRSVKLNLMNVSKSGNE